MKKTGCALLVLSFIANTAAAQYKKASFFKKGHKNYGVTAGMRFFGEGLKPAANFNFTYGNDKGRNRIFHWWDIGYTLGSNYTYTSNGSPWGSVATVNGKSSGYVSMAYNWAIYVLNNKNEDNTVLPFIKLGLGTTISGRKPVKETVTPATVSPDKYTMSNNSYSFDAGAGVVYKINNQLNFFGNAGYRFESSNEYRYAYTLIKNHPYFNAGIRVLIQSEDD